MSVVLWGGAGLATGLALTGTADNICDHDYFDLAFRLQHY